MVFAPIQYNNMIGLGRSMFITRVLSLSPSPPPLYVDTLYVLLPRRRRPKQVLTQISIPLYYYHTLTGLKRIYSVSLLARNTDMLCSVLASLDFNNMYVSLTTLRMFSEKIRSRKNDF